MIRSTPMTALTRARDLGIPLLVLMGLGACDLTPKIDKSKAEALVKAVLTKESLAPTSVTCPENEKNEKGHTFECTAVANEVEVHFKMEVLDDQGTVMATPRDHTMVVSSIVPELKADLEATGHQLKSLDCHGEVWVAIKGATVTCDLVDEAGKAYLWTATFTGDKGEHTHTVAPK